MPTPAVKTGSPFWQLPVTVLLEQVAASPDGLSSAEAAARLAQFGPNLIHGERKRALLLQFLTKFRNPLVIILLIASALSAVTGDAASFFIIATIVTISVTLDFVQEYRAGQAAERLRQSVAARGQVVRDGKPLEIPLAELVPGDVAFLAAGDLVPCDGRVIRGPMVGLLEAARFEPMIHAPFLSELFTWIGIAFCITQSAIFSGLSLAIFSVSKLRLEVEAAGGNRDAALVLDLRRDTNLTLSTVLLVLSDSVPAGVGHLSSRHSSSPSLVILEGKRKAAGGRSWGRCQGTIFKALRQYKTTMRRSAAATAKCIQDVESLRIQFCKARTKNMPLAIDRLTTLRIWTIAMFFDEPEIISHNRTFWLG